jgi:hypothetical protein
LRPVGALIALNSFGDGILMAMGFHFGPQTLFSVQDLFAELRHHLPFFESIALRETLHDKAEIGAAVPTTDGVHRLVPRKLVKSVLTARLESVLVIAVLLPLYGLKKLLWLLWSYLEGDETSNINRMVG